MKSCYVWRKFLLLWSIPSIRLREPLMDSYMYKTLDDASKLKSIKFYIIALKHFLLKFSDAEFSNIY